MILFEPRWKSYIVETVKPILTPEQCDDVIRIGQNQPNKDAAVGMGKPGSGLDTKKRITTISWIPFKEMQPMYNDIDKFTIEEDFRL